MKSFHIRKNIPVAIAIASIVLLLILVAYLMNYVQQLFASDIRINLNEIAMQNKNVITSNLSVEVNKLNLIASQITEGLDRQGKDDIDTVRDLFSKYLDTKQDSSILFADNKGYGHALGEKNINIGGRQYYRLAIQGKTNISDRLISRENGTDAFVISVPIEYKKRYVGTVQKVYTLQQMFDICRVSLFSNEGTMYIINSDGYILIKSYHEGDSLETENYIRKLYADDVKAAKQLENDIKNNRAGIMETKDDKGGIFSVYTPIDSLYNWYLISSIPTDVVSKNAKTVFNMFYFILCMISVVLVCIMGYIWYSKRTQRKHLETIAFVDKVTGGYTYNKFTLELERTLDLYPNIDFYLVMLDIDKFKYINSLYGFEFGDKLLQEINKVVSEKLEPDEMIAHIYSDRFILVLKDVTKKRLSNILNATHELLSIRVYMSAGVYAIVDRQESINLMVDKASIATKTVKGIQHKRIGFYSEQFDKQMLKNEKVKREVEQAIAANAFVPFFQPKIDINNRQLIGAEALVRWPTTDGKIVSPGEFIPVCENTGQIVFIDMIIFEKTLDFLRANMNKGIACVPISVNFSRLHLQEEDFVDKIIAKLKEYNVPPFLIEIEITESVMLETSDIIVQFIEKAHQHNLLISMDDFGSGYSSLSMLKDVKIDILKIDGEFLRDTLDNDRQQVIFGAIVKMAKELNMTIIVEGVETVEHVELMRSLGCYIAQGYYYARPLEQSVFEKVYQEGYV